MDYVFENVKVGDQFRQRKEYYYSIEGCITVTELTDKGFKYTVEKPYNILPARMGPSLATDGELLINEHPQSMWNVLYERI